MCFKPCQAKIVSQQKDILTARALKPVPQFTTTNKDAIIRAYTTYFKLITDLRFMSDIYHLFNKKNKIHLMW
jgi:hypothetical protein